MLGQMGARARWPSTDATRRQRARIGAILAVGAILSLACFGGLWRLQRLNASRPVPPPMRPDLVDPENRPLETGRPDQAVGIDE